MRILITGITGFVGSHLAEYAIERGAEVFGAIRWRSRMEHIEPLRDRMILIESDLRDMLSVRMVLERARPDYIIHLAAQSFVHASWQTPTETLNTNVLSQINLFEGMRQLDWSARFLVIGSSEEYGLVEPHELPVSETNPLRPLSPYAVSKVVQDLMGWQYFRSYGMPVVRARAPPSRCGSRTSSRLPEGSRKYNSRPVKKPCARYVSSSIFTPRSWKSSRGFVIGRVRRVWGDRKEFRRRPTIQSGPPQPWTTRG